MKNQEVIKRLSKMGYRMITAIEDDIIYIAFDEGDIEAIEMAVAALVSRTINIEVTEIHQFAKPDDVNNIDFPGTNREDK